MDLFIPSKSSPARGLAAAANRPLQFALVAAALLLVSGVLLQEPAAAQEAAKDSPADTKTGQGTPALTPSLPFYPLDIAVNDDGVAYVVDRNLPGLWRWQDEKLTILFEASKKFRTPLNAARSIAIDKDGSILVGDSSTREVYRITDNGKPEPITGGKIGIPMDLAVASDGTIYVANLELRQLVKILPGTGEVEVVASVNPRGITVDAQDRVWVISQDKEQLQIIGADGKSQTVVSDRVFEFPHQIVVNAAGEAFISDGYKKAIWKVTEGGKPEILFEGAPLDNPVGIALVEDQVIIVDPRARMVFKLSDENQPEAWFEIGR